MNVITFTIIYIGGSYLILHQIDSALSLLVLGTVHKYLSGSCLLTSTLCPNILGVLRSKLPPHHYYNMYSITSKNKKISNNGEQNHDGPYSFYCTS
jgi:hypothetical protein